MTDVLLDVLIDTAKILPFLFLTYLLMEYVENRMEGKTAKALAQADRMGPLVGACVGIVPQCGFSATAAGLYAGGLISAGTLCAVFLSTSDEMLPVMISQAASPLRILRVIGWKVVLAFLSGLIIDRILRKKGKGCDRVRIHDLCEHDHCSCGDGHGKILRPALLHTGKTILFIFLISLAAAILLHLIGEDRVAAFLSAFRFPGILLAGLVGLIPNCAASVMLTTLFLQGILGKGQMMAGLLCSTGVGLLVLFRSNRHHRENLRILGLVYVFGVFWGIVLELLPVAI